MKKILLTAILFLTFSTVALAHSGRTDKCGGHNDRKHGGYHVHNYSKYCACYPDSSECKESRKDSTDKTEETDEKAKTKPAPEPKK